MVSGSFQGYFTVGVEADSLEEARSLVEEGILDDEIAGNGFSVQVEDIESEEWEEDETDDE